jgi:hypothetical protein
MASLRSLLSNDHPIPVDSSDIVTGAGVKALPLLYTKRSKDGSVCVKADFEMHLPLQYGKNAVVRAVLSEEDVKLLCAVA